MGGVFYVGWMAVHGGGVRYDDFKAIGNPDHAMHKHSKST